MKQAYIFFFISFFLTLPQSALADIDPAKRVAAAIEYWRDLSSYTEAEMQIHRPEWKREMAFEAWTQGMDNSLVRFIKPAKDAGNASLKAGDEMWNFSPKINRVVKIPPSMMSQSWMGSDFSYNDLARADEIVDRYTHTLIGEEEHEGLKVHVIQSVPHEDAPVVWGKEVLKIRADNIMLEQAFYDQDMKLIKRMYVREIRELGNKLYPTISRMENIEDKGKWTEVRYISAKFNIELSDRIFTLSNLRNPRS